MHTPTCIWKGPAALAEGPLWHPTEQALYWIDITEKQLHRLDPKTQQHKSWEMPALIGAIALHHDGGLIAGLGDNIVKIDLPSATIMPLVDVIQGDTDLRLNDGRCDARGRFWVGVAHATKDNPRGGLFRYDPDGTLHQMESNITISNGLGWSPDNRVFYYTDSLRHCIYRYDFDLETGTINNRHVFATVANDREPDGLTVDSEGYIWSAQWNGAQLIRFTPNGEVDQTITLPTPRVTSCGFGGNDMNTLFITTCSRNVGESEALAAPAGSLFAITLSVGGSAEPQAQC
jgi:sugar lactone lactonase YvrE